MSNLPKQDDLQVVQQPPANLLWGFSPEQVSVIKDNCAKGSTDQELNLYLAMAQARGLDPLAREIYLIIRGSEQYNNRSAVIQTGIDGFRKIASRTGLYEGQMETEWCDDKGNWSIVWLDKTKPPFATKVGVLRKGFIQPLYRIARYDSYVQRKRDGTPTETWQKMPDVMLAKCAEALALRAAFPDYMAGLYTNDEMEQAEIALAPQENGQLATISQPKKEKPMNIIQQPDGSIVDAVSGEQITPPTKVVWDEKTPEYRSEKQHRDIGILMSNAITYGVMVPNKKGEFKPITLEYINSVEKRLAEEPSKTVYGNFDKLFKEAIERKIHDEEIESI